jgi:hypothetical protein
MMFFKAGILLTQWMLLSSISQSVASEQTLRKSDMDDYSRSLSTGTLQYVGNNGAVGLLDNCQGDCDRDTECKPGLKCYQRTGSQAVPGCTGDQPNFRGFDFCYKPAAVPVPVPVPVSAPAGTLKIIGNDGGPGFPLNACEGDCDRDSDCKSGLKCKQRKGAEVVPGCTGDMPNYKGTDFCYKP